MSIFKRKRTIDGKVVKSNEYTVQFKDMSGVWRRVTAFVDKSASKQLDQGIQRLVDIRQVNGLLEATDNQFLEACPTHVLLKLVDWGIIDKHRIAAKKVVDEQIEDWITHLKSKNSTKKHVKEMAGYVKRTLDQCKWDRVSDINGDDFNALMVTLMDRGRSLSLLNHYIRAMKCFCNWLHSERRIIENPFKLIQKYNEQTDRRRYRRALTIDELGKLVGAADAGGVVHSMTGATRGLLYLMAAFTGLRWSELRSLRRMDIDLTTEPAAVTIRASMSKNRKLERLPLRPELVTRLVRHFETFPMEPESMVFTGMWLDKGSKMMKVDLDKAKVPVMNEHGIADFHALRTTFASLLNEAGVPLVTAQQLMRHSDPKLTAVFYTRTTVMQRAAAVGLIPDVVPAKPQSEAGTAEEKEADKSTEKNRDSGGETSQDSMEPPPEKAGEGVDGHQSPLKLVDTQVDTNKTDLDGKTRNETEWESLKKAAGAEGMTNEKSPENGGFIDFPRIPGLNCK